MGALRVKRHGGERPDEKQGAEKQSEMARGKNQAEQAHENPRAGKDISLQSSDCSMTFCLRQMLDKSAEAHLHGHKDGSRAPC
jgi:hypothetical protein